MNEHDISLLVRIAELEVELANEQERVIFIDAARDAAEARLAQQAERATAVTEALTELERALCEFTNAASDQYDPSEWIPETKRNFEALCEAYNKAYTAGCFPVPAALRASSTGGKG